MKDKTESYKMHIRQFLLSILIITSVLADSNAQNTKFDSLVNLLGRHPEQDTVRVDLLNQIAAASMRNTPEKSLTYAKKALRLAEKLNYKKGIASSFKLHGIYYYLKSDYPVSIDYYQKSLNTSKEIEDNPSTAGTLNNIGIAYNVQGKYALALEHYYQSLKLKEELGKKSGIASSLNNIGITLRIQGNYPQALFTHQRSLRLLEELGDNRGIASTLTNIGNIYMDRDNYPLALEYYQRSLKVRELIGDKRGIAILLNNIGNILEIRGNYLLALDHHQESLEIREGLGDKLGIASSLNNIGLIQAKQGNYPLALDYHQRSLKIRKEIGNRHGLSSSHKNLGSLYLSQRDYDKALSHTMESLKIAKELETFEGLLDTYKQLAEIYAATEDYKLAYQNHVTFKQLNDTIFNEENIKGITGLEYQYKFDKEKQVIRLEQEKKDAVVAEEAKQQQIIHNALIGGFIFLLLLVLLEWRSLVHRRQANNLLMTQAEELRLARQKAEVANQAKSDFLAHMSHEIRQPLTSILGFSEILHLEEVNTKKRRFLQSIRSSGESLLNLVNDVLDLSKIEAGKMELQHSSVSIQDLFKEMSTIFSHQITDKGIDFKVTVDSTIPESLLLDETRLRQILINLIGNAVKFTDKGFIRLSGIAKEEASGVLSQVSLIIEVADSGHGIGKEDQKRIFGEFEQVMGEEAQAKGTGLGLAITKRIVKLMDGSISVASEEGKGTAFRIELKGVEVTIKETEEEWGFDPNELEFAPAKVLITDDIEYNRDLIAAYLSPFNFEIYFAENGKVAFEQAQEHRPDLILMDIRMPEMDGYEASKRLKDEDWGKDIPIIAVTASGMVQDKEAILLQFDGYLAKPLSQFMLINEINKFLESTRSDAVV
ncbi:MAG: tetratricopeptide repeat protein [Gammaproteobacteria bacterium]|nr:tetratricopeptide repeat protein [Gammaproteobacteria bacterium]